MRPSFRSLFDSHAAYVLGRLRWLGVPDRDRQDVAQEVFERIARHLDELDPARPARPWILAITCNAARDYHRRAHVRREQLDAVLQEVPVHDAHDQLAAAELVRRLLATLSHEAREVLVLVALEERPVPEAAGILGIGVKACESRLARARVQLEEALQRLRATERRRLGESAPLGVLVALPLDELLGASRHAPEDFGAEVAALRARFAGSLLSPAPAAAVGTPAATWLVLGLLGACVRGLGSPSPIAMCPAVVDVVAAAPPVTPSASPAPTVEARAVPLTSGAVALAAPSEPSHAPAPPSPCVRTVTPPAELSEISMMGLARRALNERSPERAAAWLRRHQRVYPHGSLAVERDVMLARLGASK